MEARGSGWWMQSTEPETQQESYIVQHYFQNEDKERNAHITKNQGNLLLADITYKKF